MLLAELNHRVKNTLGTVQAIAVQSLARAANLEQFRGGFTSRLQALSRTHDLLAKDSWRGVGLRAIAEAELIPYRSAEQLALSVEGRPVKLNAKIALAMSMTLHELATNAGKYGALSTPHGYVGLKWTTLNRDGRPWLRVEWSEHGGPEVTKPSRLGFGTRTISEGLVYELGAEVSLDFPVTGVVCTIQLPLPPDAERDDR